MATLWSNLITQCAFNSCSLGLLYQCKYAQLQHKKKGVAAVGPPFLLSLIVLFMLHVVSNNMLTLTDYKVYHATDSDDNHVKDPKLV